jgi:hypothetical protein
MNLVRDSSYNVKVQDFFYKKIGDRAANAARQMITLALPRISAEDRDIESGVRCLLIGAMQLILTPNCPCLRARFGILALALVGSYSHGIAARNFNEGVRA